MKILAFAASNSRNSINRTLIDYAIQQLQTGVLPNAEIETLDLNAYEMPIYSIDRELKDGIPAPAHHFFDQIGTADAIMVSFAEHNGSVTAAWKNIFDWMSRIDAKVFQGKPLVMLAASPGPRAGAGVLGHQEMLLPHFGGQIIGQLGIGTWFEAWDGEAKTLNRPQDIAALTQTLSALQLHFSETV